MKPRLKMHDICKSFGATLALDHVDIEVDAGQVHAIVGENGAGKSTLMKVLSGAYHADQGKMWIDGQPYRPNHPRDGRRNGIAMIYQELSLAPHLSVMENILLGMEPVAGPFLRRGQMCRLAESALQKVGREDLDAHARVADLSLADRQQVEIARSVASGCKILVLDEPTSSLSAQDIEKLFDLIRQLRDQGIGILYISHYLEEVQQISNRFTVLRDGKRVGSGNAREVSAREIVNMMVGRSVDQLYPRSERQTGSVLLSIENLMSRKSSAAASLELRRGEVVGIAGLVGSGRTELMRAIFGLDQVRSGFVRVGSFHGAAVSKMWARRVGLVSEDRKTEGLALNLSLAENITLPWLRNLGPLQLVFPSRQRAACQKWIASLPIKCVSASQTVADLSGGNQQKVAIARLLHAEVDVLLLDEPTRGIDVGSKAQIYKLIDQLVSGHHGAPAKAVLLISSYLPELLGVCDRIAVMSRGRLGPALPTNQWSEHKIMMDAVGSTQSVVKMG